MSVDKAKDIAFVLGVGLIATACFMIYVPLGLLFLGTPFIIWSLTAAAKKK